MASRNAGSPPQYATPSAVTLTASSGRSPAGREQRPAQDKDEPEHRPGMATPGRPASRVTNHRRVGERRYQRRTGDAQDARRLHPGALGEPVELPRAKGAGHCQQGDERHPAVPHDGERQRDGDDRERHPGNEIAVGGPAAGIHQTETRPKRRSRR